MVHSLTQTRMQATARQPSSQLGGLNWRKTTRLQIYLFSGSQKTVDPPILCEPESAHNKVRRVLLPKEIILTLRYLESLYVVVFFTSKRKVRLIYSIVIWLTVPYPIQAWNFWLLLTKQLWILPCHRYSHPGRYDCRRVAGTSTIASSH